MATDITAAVVAPHQIVHLESKPTIPIETATMVAFGDANDAHYFCALLNSSPARLVIDSYASKSTGSFGAPHILQHVAIPRLDPSTSMFANLSSLSHRAHQFAAKGKDAENELLQVEEEIDRKAAELWGITTEDLAEIQRSLNELE